MDNSLIAMWGCRRRVERRADRAAAAAFRSAGGTLTAAQIDSIFAFQPAVVKRYWARSRRLTRTDITLEGVTIVVYVNDMTNFGQWNALHNAISRGELAIDDPPCKQLKFTAANTPWEGA